MMLCIPKIGGIFSGFILCYIPTYPTYFRRSRRRIFNVSILIVSFSRTNRKHDKDVIYKRTKKGDNTNVTSVVHNPTLDCIKD